MLGIRALASHLQWVIKCLQRKRLSSNMSKGEWVHHQTYGIHAPNEGPSDLVPSRNSFPPIKALQRQANSPSKGSQVTSIMLRKPYIVKEPPEHVHQDPPLKINKCSKTLCNLSNLGMGGLSWWPIGWIIPQVKECFPGGLSLSHVKSMRWIGVILLGMGFINIQGLILSHLWVPL